MYIIIIIIIIIIILFLLSSSSSSSHSLHLLILFLPPMLFFLLSSFASPFHPLPSLILFFLLSFSPSHPFSSSAPPFPSPILFFLLSFSPSHPFSSSAPPLPSFILCFPLSSSSFSHPLLPPLSLFLLLSICFFSAYERDVRTETQLKGPKRPARLYQLKISITMNGRASQPGGVPAVTAIFSRLSYQRHRLTDHLPAN